MVSAYRRLDLDKILGILVLSHPVLQVFSLLSASCEKSGKKGIFYSFHSRQSIAESVLWGNEPLYSR